MANKIDEEPKTDNPSQKHSDEEFNKLTSHEHMAKDGKSGELSGKPKTVDLDKAEDDATQSDSQKSDSSEASKGLYQADKGPRKGTLWSATDRFKGFSRVKKRIISGGVMMGIAGVLAVVLMSAVTPALELFHIKEVLTQRIGDVQSLVVKTRSGKLYSRAFFFDENGFDGYKSRGSIFSIYDNYKTSNLLDDIRGVDDSFNIDYNQKTGRVNSISWTDSDGVLQKVGSAEEFEGMWKKRGGIRAGLETAYPDKGYFWRARQARRLYARAGLTYSLSNFLENTRLAKAVDDLAAKLGKSFTPMQKVVAKLRYAAFGNIFDDYTPGNLHIVTKDTTEDAADAETASAKESKAIASDLADEGDNLVDDLLEKGPDYRPDSLPPSGSRGFVGSLISGSADEIAVKMAKASATAAVVGNIVDTAEKVCRVKYLADIVEIGARTVRSEKLGEYFTNFAGPADAGKVEDLSSESVSGMVQRVHTVDSNGDGFYAGGGWDWASGGNGVVNPDNIDKFSTSGGSVETLSLVNSFINQSGGGVISKSCSVATNPLFQVIVGVGEAAVTYGPCATGLGCTFTASKLAAGATIAAAKEAAFAIIMAVIRPIAVRIVAGAVVDYLEVGPEMSDALVSGASAWFGRRSASSGMRPLTSRLFSQLESEVKDEKIKYYAQQGFYEKYLDPTNTNSVLFASLVKIPHSVDGFTASLKSMVSGFDPVGLLASTFYNNASAGTALALNDASSQCADPAIVDNNIATDPFCNPIYGEDLEKLDAVDPLDNINWMIDSGYISPNLSPSGEVQYCDEDPGIDQSRCSSDYKDYVEQCFLPVTTIKNEKNEVQTKCFSDGPDVLGTGKYLRFRTFRLDRDLSEGIADSINRDFDY